VDKGLNKLNVIVDVFFDVNDDCAIEKSLGRQLSARRLSGPHPRNGFTAGPAQTISYTLKKSVIGRDHECTKSFCAHANSFLSTALPPDPFLF
jgi:hypothetical protein